MEYKTNSERAAEHEEWPISSFSMSVIQYCSHDDQCKRCLRIWKSIVVLDLLKRWLVMFSVFGRNFCLSSPSSDPRRKNNWIGILLHNGEQRFIPNFSADVSNEVCNGKLLWRFCSDFASSHVEIFVYKLFWWFDGKNVQVPPLLYVYASSKEIQTLCCKKTNIVHPLWLNLIINAIGETCISSISRPNFWHGWVSLQCSNKPKWQLRQLHSHVRTILATPLCLLETMVASGGSQWNTSTYLICPGSVQKNIVEVTLRSKKKC